MYSQSAIHHELAHDRHLTVLRSAGVDHPAAPHVAHLAAHRRAEATTGRQTSRPEPAFAWLTRRLRTNLRLRLHGV
jgi:hypothetical protein